MPSRDLMTRAVLLPTVFGLVQVADQLLQSSRSSKSFGRLARGNALPERHCSRLRQNTVGSPNRERACRPESNPR
jgi:hypothetical protein